MGVMLYGVGLRFVFTEGLRKSNGQLRGGLAKSGNEKHNARKSEGIG